MERPLQAMCAGSTLPLSLSQGYLIRLKTEPGTDSNSSSRSPSALSSNDQQATAASMQQNLQPDIQAPVEQASGAPSPGHTDDGASGTVTPPRPRNGSAGHADDCSQHTASTLGRTYMACQGPGTFIVGATQQYDYTPERALEECGRVPEPHEAEAAAGAMLPSRVAQQLMRG